MEFGAEQWRNAKEFICPYPAGNAAGRRERQAPTAGT
jgi:hypothetical protein